MPKSRSEAISAGANRYFTGEPCKYGHLCERSLNSHCVECDRIRTLKYYHDPKNKARVKARVARYMKTDAGKAAQSKYWASPKGAANSTRYRSTEKGRTATRRSNAKRQYAWRKRTPKWVDINAIEEFVLRKPDGYHIDHIIPLRGGNVSGLHVLENLQYLPADKNRAKSNSVIPITLEAAVCPL
jgi:hypothetical protein